MNAARTPSPDRTACALGAVGADRARCSSRALASVAPPRRAGGIAAVPPPDGAETFHVSQSDAGASTRAVPDPRRPARVLHLDRRRSRRRRRQRRRRRVRVGRRRPARTIRSPARRRSSASPTTRSAARGERSEQRGRRQRDGRYVAFTSAATNLVAAGGTAGARASTCATRCSARPSACRAPPSRTATSYDPDLSDDGRYLVFTSDATEPLGRRHERRARRLLADLDANGDGIFGDIALTRFIGDVVARRAAPSRRGSAATAATVVFTPHQDRSTRRTPPTVTTGDFVYPRAGARGRRIVAHLVGRERARPDHRCDRRHLRVRRRRRVRRLPAVIAVTWTRSYYYARSGRSSPTPRRLHRRSGDLGGRQPRRVDDDGPAFDFARPPPQLPDARRPHAGVAGGTRGPPSLPRRSTRLVDIAEGTQPSLSASARTVAYSAPATAAPSRLRDGHPHARRPLRLEHPGLSSSRPAS